MLGTKGFQVALVLAFGLCGGLACGPALPDGPTPLPIGQDLELALGRQRLLVPVSVLGPDGAHRYRVSLAPAPGDAALLRAALCQLDGHLRRDEGDSHCLGLAVAVDAAGQSEAVVAAPDSGAAEARRFNALALDVFSEGPSHQPVILRVTAQ